MDILKPVHHSLVDWEFQPGAGFAITSDRYVSPPSSLYRPIPLNPTNIGYMNLKPTISGNLLDGRVTTYYLVERTDYMRLQCIFRAQTLPYLGLPANCYRFVIDFGHMAVIRRLAGIETTIAVADQTPFESPLTWYRYRFTWYTWVDASLKNVIRFLLDREEAGSWKNWITADLENPDWQTAPQNYMGFSMAGFQPTGQNFIDDTEVYARFSG